MFPNVIIGGISKAGTTSLFRYLANHSNVCASSIKEVRFFSQNRIINKETLEKYASYFSHCTGNEKIILEASPAYLYGGQKVIEPIINLLPDVKIIFILRDPVKRFVSHFNYVKSKLNIIPDDMSINVFAQRYLEGSLSELSMSNNQIKSISESIEAGFYKEYINEYLGRFDGGNIYICFFEKLKEDPVSFISDICQYLEIDSDFYANYNFTIENKTRLVKYKKLAKLAEKINLFIEPVLNKYPLIRKILRSTYYSINKEIAINDEILAPQLEEKLYNFFLQKNKGLSNVISDCCAPEFKPDWIN